jgi:hypothetical protein
MTKAILRLLVLTTVCGLLAAGCYHRVAHERVVATPSNPVVVEEPPPSPRTEVVGVTPGPTHVWQSGFWSYTEGRWIWAPGRWVLRPNPNAVWVRGHWDRSDHHWTWTPGRWE